MYKPGMKFSEGLRISWERELKLRKPGRILTLAFWTIILGAAHPFIPIIRQLKRIKIKW